MQILHNAPRTVGPLFLLNMSADGTVATRPATNISTGGEVWWSLRDGVLWDATHGASARIDPYELTAFYRGRCQPTADCTWIDLRITLSLRSRQLGGGWFSASQLVGERHVAVAAFADGRAGQPRSCLINYNATWSRCALRATVTLTDEPLSRDVVCASPVAPGASTVGGAMQEVYPSDEHRSWCTSVEAADVLDDAGDHILGSTPSVDLTDSPDACEMMAGAQAVNSVHISYFLHQQEEERRLLDGAATSLCAGAPDEATYQRRLHALLAPLRMAVRLHIHTAFMAKQRCAANAAVDRQRAMEQQQLEQLPSYGFGYFNLREAPSSGWLTSYLHSADGDPINSAMSGDEPGRGTWLHLLAPYARDANSTARVGGHSPWRAPIIMSVRPEYLPEQPDPDNDFCPLPILHHEPWNTWESWHVQNYTSHLLRAGAQFCATPSTRTALISQWRTKLLEVQQAHRGNNAFIVYYKAYEAACQRTAGTAWQEHVAPTLTRQTASYTADLEALRAAGPCDGAGVTASDLIYAFGNDTQVTLSVDSHLGSNSARPCYHAACAHSSSH